MIRTDRAAAQSGQAIVIIALMFAALLAVTGLAADSGRAYFQRRGLQNATDAAVLTYADWLNNFQPMSTAEQKAAAMFARNMDIYGTASFNPGYCAALGTNPSAGSPPTCTTTVTWSGDSQSRVLTLTYTDYRGTAKGVLLQATSSEKMGLLFLQTLGAGPSVNLGATAQTVLFDQSQTPALLVLGTNCSSSPPLVVSGGPTVTVVGAIYSDGTISVSNNSTVNVTGNVYEACGSVPIGNVSNPGYSQVEPVAQLNINYTQPPAAAYYSSSQTWPSSTGNVEVQPGVYASDPHISSSVCYFMDPGVYEFKGGYTDNGGMNSNELRPPDEPYYNNMSNRAGTPSGTYTQFWRDTSACDGTFAVQNADSLNPLSGGQWSVVVTAAREDAYYPNYPSSSTPVWYARESPPSMCQTMVLGSSKGFQVAISNVPGAQWYNVYAYKGACPTDPTVSPDPLLSFGYVGSVCAGQAAVESCSKAFTETNTGVCPSAVSWIGTTPLTAGPRVTTCGLDGTVSPVFDNTALSTWAPTGTQCTWVQSPNSGTPLYPNSGGAQPGCAPPDPELCPSSVTGCISTSPYPPNEVPGRNTPHRGDAGNENECADTSGNVGTCPGTVTPGAVQFYFPNYSGACLDQEGNGGTWFFSGSQYAYIAVYSSASSPTDCGGSSPNKIAGGAATSFIGTTYFPVSSVVISGGSKAPISGQVIAQTCTIDGSSGVTIDFNANLAPPPPSGRLVL